MTTSSLGYEPNTILSKHEVALLQLDDAISLFIVKRFLAALTLSGAAEEILGKLLQWQGALPTIKASAAAIAQLRLATGLQAMGTASEKEIIDTWNHARNNAKHLIGSGGNLSH